MTMLRVWSPAALLAVGALLTVGVDHQRSMPLSMPLDTAMPLEVEGFRGTDIEISAAEQRVAGMTSYVMRIFSADAADTDLLAAAFSVYVGYYDQQMQGRTIHSPKNCLPGSGWDALIAQPAVIATAAGRVQVNRYLLRRDQEKALVLFGYQGRGRIESNEYAVKWDLLRDAALMRRSDEALVRVLVPVVTTEEAALELAVRVAQRIIPAVDAALPL
jgi:EpsI family protein